MKKCFAVMIVFALLITYPTVSMGMSYSSKIYKSYNYTYYGEPVDCPAAYVPYRILDHQSLGLENTIEPSDLFVTDNGILYIVDSKNNMILLLDKEFKVIRKIEQLADDEGVSILKNPEGVFVNAEHEIYVADTGNNRIVVIDQNAKILREYKAPEIDVMNDVTSYLPSKLVVDRAGRIYVAARNINRGLLELDSNGKFIGFIGAPKVIPNMADYFWKMISTKEQKRRMAKFVPTEYNNVCIDGAGFIYATIGANEISAVRNTINNRDMSGYVALIRKLNPTGQDVLRRKGFYPPVGDVRFDGNGPSVMVDVQVADNGMYSLLDAKRGRVFTYDMDGNLLYIYGGFGKQKGLFQSAAAIERLGEYMIVADKATGVITIFRITEYGKCINEAVQNNYDGQYDAAALMWEKALKYNSNLYIAYIGIGKTYLRKSDYQNAMKNFTIAREKTYYSKAFRLERKYILYNNFGKIGAAFVGILICFTLYKVNRRRRTKRYINY